MIIYSLSIIDVKISYNRKKENNDLSDYSVLFILSIRFQMLIKEYRIRMKKNRRKLDEYVMSMAMNVNRKIVLTCSIFNIPLNYGWLLSFHVTYFAISFGALYGINEHLLVFS